MIQLTFLLAILFFFWFVYINKFILAKLPKNYPNETNRKLADKKKKTLVCFGDSNTHGNVSYNWVDQLRTRFGNLNVFNAGINADLTFTLLNRIDEVIQCQPDFITILIGTNDANAFLSEKNLIRYISKGKVLPEEKINQESFRINYEIIITELKTKTKAQIALISLPLLGEDTSFRGNDITQIYSEEIKTLSTIHNIDFLDFREEQIALIPKNNSNKNWSFSKSRVMLLFSVLLHYTLQMSWDFISKLFYNTTSPDNIHLNETSGGRLLNLVYDWVLKKQAQELHELA